MLRASVVVSAINGAGQAVSFVLFFLVARSYGASATTDAFFLALAVPTVITAPVANAIVSVLVPRMTIIRVRAPDELPTLAGLSLAWVTAVGVAGSLLLVVFAPFAATVLAGGLGPDETRLFVDYTRIMAPMIAFQLAAAVLSAAMNAVGQYYRPAVCFILRHGSAAVVLLAFRDTTGGYVLPWALLLGSFIQLFVLALSVPNLPYRIRPVFRVDKTTLGLTSSAGILLAASILLQATALLARVFATRFGPGAVTIIDYGARLTAAVIELLGSGILLVTLVNWSELVAQARDVVLRASVQRAFLAALLIASPAAAVLVVGRESLATFVFGLEMRDGATVLALGQILALFSLGIPLEVLNRLSLRLFLAWNAVGMVGLFAALRLLSFVLLVLGIGGTFGLAGVAIAEIGSLLVCVFVVLLVLRRRLGGIGTAVSMVFVPAIAGLGAVGGWAALRLWSSGRPLVDLALGSAAVLGISVVAFLLSPGPAGRLTREGLRRAKRSNMSPS
jgi:putative peptidoglycan lipid II flippase